MLYGFWIFSELSLTNHTVVLSLNLCNYTDMVWLFANSRVLVWFILTWFSSFPSLLTTVSWTVHLPFLQQYFWLLSVYVVSKAPFTRYNLLSNRFGQTVLYNRFDNRVERTVCSFNTVVKPVVQPALTTGLTTASFNRLSNWVVQPAWQPVVSCKWGLSDSIGN